MSSLNDNNPDVALRLSATRALWGAVTPNVRAVSAELAGHKIRWRVIFAEAPSEAEQELVSEAATEIIADFPWPHTIDEEYLVLPAPQSMSHLKYLIYLRHEGSGDSLR